jgi:uncharacterized membrane protein YphA (DoxX/SURF4 family)
MARQLTLWTLIFLVVLRLAIGWQFLTEGLQKVRSNYLIGPAEISKPFSSEGYFRNSTGPFSALVRSQIRDLDEQLQAFTKLEPPPEGHPPTELPVPERMPVALGRVWDGHMETLFAVYPFDGIQMDRARAATRQAKSDYVRWLQSGDKELERKLSGNVVKMKLTTKARLAEYEAALAKVREIDSQRWVFFHDVDRDGQALARARLIELRTDLLNDVDEQSEKFHKALADIVRQKIDDALVLPGDPHELQGELVKLLTLSPTSARTPSADYPYAGFLPPALDGHWAAYLDALQTHLKVTDKKQQETGKRLLDRARDQTVRWLLDRDAQGTRAASLVGLALSGNQLSPLLIVDSAAARALNPGPPDRLLEFKVEKRRVEDLRKLEQAAVDSATFVPSPALKEAEDNLDKLTKSLKTDLDTQTKSMKAGLEEMLTDAQKKVTVPRYPEGWTFIKILDLVTICVITGAGLFLMLGLFTRTACILAAGFLLLTFLSAPPFPWLPLPPATEGNPLYVNKNLIEFFALLALVGSASGKWFGIDALLARLFGKREPEPAVESKTADSPG